MECEDGFKIFREVASVLWEAVGDVGDEVDKVAEGDDAGGRRGCGGSDEDVSLRLVLAVLIYKIFAV